MLMTTYIDSKIVTLSSKSATIFKNGSYLSNLKFELGSFLTDDKDIVHRQICLQSAQIPYSFYIVNYTCNLLKINSNTYIIPVGNYNATSLINAIILQIQIDFPLMTISLNKVNGILTFSNNTDFIIYNNFLHSIGNILGFSTNSTNTSVSHSLTASYPLNLLGIKVLEIRSTVLSMNNVSSTLGGLSTLLASIPVSSTPFGMIDYGDKGNNQMTFYNSVLDDLDIEITDGETGEYINFNNIGWTMTFIIHITRLSNISLDRTNNFNQLINNSITNESINKNEPINKNLEDLKLLTE